MAHTEPTNAQTGTNSASKASKQKLGRREQIVHAAREICLDKGFTHITVSDITNKAGITRSLFYHYFHNKEDIASALLEDAVNTIISRLTTWNKNRESGNINKSLDEIIVIMRTLIADEGPFSKKMVQSGNGELYIQFVDQISQRVAEYISKTTVEDFVRLHGSLPINHVKETLMMLISGSIALLREQPQITDKTVKEIFIQTLQLQNYL